MTPKLAEDIKLLSDKRSPKRCAAAKRLRKLGDPAAGPALVAAIEKELQDSRTWETQYQMLMAIGHCDYRDAIPYLESLVAKVHQGWIDIALGDTMLRLSRTHEHDAAIAVKYIDAGRKMLSHGAVQALSMLRMVPDEPIMRRLVAHGLSLPFGEDDWTVIWLLRAAPGWPAEIVAPLIDHWSAITFLQDQQIRDAVDLARKRKYYKWSPL